MVEIVDWKDYSEIVVSEAVHGWGKVGKFCQAKVRFKSI